MYEVFEKLCAEKEVRPAQVARDTGIAHATLTEWKKGTYTPKSEKLQKIADYFGVSVDYLMTGQHPEQTSESGRKYYFSDETAEAAQELFENKDLRALLSAARDVSPEAIKAAATLLKAWKDTNPNG